MKRQYIYRYLGENGILDTPILFKDLPHVVRYRLIASDNKVLVKDDIKCYAIDINAEDLEKWHEEDDDTNI